MKTYRIIISTEYIIEANSEEEAKDMVDYSHEVDAYYELIEEISEEEQKGVDNGILRNLCK